MQSKVSSKFWVHSCCWNFFSPPFHSCRGNPRLWVGAKFSSFPLCCRSVAQSCPTLCHTVDRSTPGFSCPSLSDFLWHIFYRWKGKLPKMGERDRDRQRQQERQTDKEGIIQHTEREMLVFFSQCKLRLFICFIFFCFILQPYL